MSDVPAETINLDACSKLISKNIKFFLGTINKNPLVGFGVVGTKTFTSSFPILSLIIPLFSFVANPTAQTSFLDIQATRHFFVCCHFLINSLSFD